MIPYAIFFFGWVGWMFSPRHLRKIHPCMLLSGKSKVFSVSGKRVQFFFPLQTQTGYLLSILILRSGLVRHKIHQEVSVWKGPKNSRLNYLGWHMMDDGSWSVTHDTIFTDQDHWQQKSTEIEVGSVDAVGIPQKISEKIPYPQTYHPNGGSFAVHPPTTTQLHPRWQPTSTSPHHNRPTWRSVVGVLPLRRHSVRGWDVATPCIKAKRLLCGIIAKFRGRQ